MQIDWQYFQENTLYYVWSLIGTELFVFQCVFFAYGKKNSCELPWGSLLCCDGCCARCISLYVVSGIMLSMIIDPHGHYFSLNSAVGYCIELNILIVSGHLPIKAIFSGGLVWN